MKKTKIIYWIGSGRPGITGTTYFHRICLNRGLL